MSLIKQLGVLVLLALLAAGGYAGYQHQFGGAAKPKASAVMPGGAGQRAVVETAPARVKDLTEKLEAVGTSRAKSSVDIVPLATGRIVELTFESGEKVSNGEILVRLDDDIQRADAMEAEAKKMQADLALSRAQTLGKDNISTRATIEQLQAAAAAAQAELDRARRRLADRVIRAPFAGITGLKQVDVGAQVDDKTVITRLDDVSEVELEFSLPEGTFGEIRKGQEITATAAAFPGRTFTGRITAIDNRIDPVARAFKVRALLPNPDLVLPAGMFMLISVVLDQKPGVVVPEEAVVVTGEQATVFVVKDGKAKQQAVKLGLREPGLVEIVSGVADGDEVVVRGVQRLRDGMAVEARPLDPNATTAKTGSAG
ncbi:MAG: efflux RND transporter periplasmic adaptor subunit [Hyphomicrobiales bacterium]